MCRGRIAALAAAIGVVLAPGTAAAADCAGANVVPTSKQTIAKAQKAVICLINAERKAGGLGALKANGKLKTSATAWARRMDDENFFAHTRKGSTARSRIKATGYIDGAHAFRLAENIGWGSGTLATPASRLRGWLSSSLHRKNLMTGDFKEIGVGIAGAPQAGVHDGAVYVLNFGRVTK